MKLRTFLLAWIFVLGFGLYESLILPKSLVAFAQYAPPLLLAIGLVRGYKSCWWLLVIYCGGWHFVPGVLEAFLYHNYANVTPTVLWGIPTILLLSDPPMSWIDNNNLWGELHDRYLLFAPATSANSTDRETAELQAKREAFLLWWTGKSREQQLRAWHRLAPEERLWAMDNMTPDERLEFLSLETSG